MRVRGSIIGVRVGFDWAGVVCKAQYNGVEQPRSGGVHVRVASLAEWASATPSKHVVNRVHISLFLNVHVYVYVHIYICGRGF